MNTDNELKEPTVETLGIISRLAELPLIVSGSSTEVFQRMRTLQEQARRFPVARLTINNASHEVDQAVADLVDEMQDEIELWRSLNQAAPRSDVFVCESCERGFTESPHATDDGYWLCDPCYESLKEEVKA